MKNEKAIRAMFGLAMILAFAGLNGCEASTDPGGNTKEEPVFIGTWKGMTVGSGRSYELELKITATTYTIYYASSTDTGSIFIEEDKITLISKLDGGTEFGWGRVKGDTMDFNITYLFAIQMFGAIGATLTREESTPPPPPPPSQSTLTVSGFPNGDAMVMILGDEDDIIALGIGTLSGGTANFDLEDEDGDPWSGSGNYYVWLMYAEYTYISDDKLSLSGTITYSASAFSRVAIGYDDI
jgi:hypothetical protein